MKNILVTGACGGMGRATVKMLAKQGFRVFALDLKACEQAENVIFIQADVTDEASIESAFEQVKTYTNELFAIVGMQDFHENEDKNV